MHIYAILTVICFALVLIGYTILVVQLYKRFTRKQRIGLIVVGILDIILMTGILIWVLNH